MTRPTLLAALLAGPLAAAEPDPGKLAFFETKVRPILAGHCSACHAADTKPAGGLRVDDRDGLLTGGNGGAAVVPGQPAEGTLIRRITQKGPRQMPLQGEKLSAEQVAVLKQWIADGAVWPTPSVPGSLGQPKPKYEALKRDHWAFQPVSRPAVPPVKDTAWPRTDVDRFVLAKLETNGLNPVGDADQVALVRRLTFDLTGLPPTPAEIDAFLADPSADAVARLVDRLLAAPGFGEHWGRHWLDVARYGESTGPSRNIPYPHAWKYRDYVIDAVGRDVPFDRFVREQIAGDLLPADSPQERDRLLTATGFLALGVKDVNQRFKPRFLMDNVDEQVDAVTRGVLALTVSCARCHDHKFDPVPQTDYYALAGIFTSTENCAGVRNQMGGAGLAYYVPDLLVRLTAVELPPVPEEKAAKLKAQVAEAKKAWDAIRGTPEGLKPGPNGQPTQRRYRLKYERLQAELNALTDPAQRGAAVHGVRDGKQPADTAARVRGEAEKQGPTVPRGFLTAFGVPDAKPVNPKQSGRLELAEWLTSPRNPLAARVAVNRVWAHLFGRGLVSTVDNFGVTGDAPSHPELLDHLAAEFVADGWSVKRLVRRLVLTRTYQLAADATPAHLKTDPANSLLWRHAPRRLTAEELRDATLLAAGNLDRAKPKGGSQAAELKMIEMRDNGPEAKKLVETADTATHRSVYLPALRGVIPRQLEAFDPVDQTLVSGTRDATTVPSQALYLLNSAFVRKHALALADRLLAEPTDDNARLTAAYRRTLGRAPTAAEKDRARLFLNEYATAARDTVTVAVEEPKPKPAEKPKATAEIVDPDQADQTGEAVREETVRPSDARAAAWQALVQALVGSAEFRYVQ